MLLLLEQWTLRNKNSKINTKVRTVAHNFRIKDIKKVAIYLK